jgi:6-phosphogluconolactonase
MKFMKYGKALLMSALSAGVVLSLSSCVQSYTVGYLYVTGTVTSESNGNGIISGFKIDHNTGKLTRINGLPVSSGGANPVRALLFNGGHFVYVLNQGANASGGSVCTAADPCKNANITEFVVGANGMLTAEATYQTQGVNPFRLIADSSSHLFVLDHDSPDNNSGATGSANGCYQALSGATSCGDITGFSINTSTGRLSLIQNLQVQVTNTASGTQNLTYFPVPADPVDFTFADNNILTLTGAPGKSDAPQSVFPYAFNTSSGQLTRTLNTADSIGDVYEATAIIYSGKYVWVLDNEPGTTNAKSQILPWTVSTNGSLTAPSHGPIADDLNQSNPIYLQVENGGKWFYVANQGSSTDTTDALSGIAGFIEHSPFDPEEISGTPVGFGAGAGPVCLVEDPSNQFFYTANFDSSTVTGQMFDPTTGLLRPLSETSKASSSYALTGPPSWCFVDGHTD